MWDTIQEQLTSPGFWVSVIFAGFVVNLLAAYAKQGFDRFVPQHWKQWRETRVELRRQRVYALSRSTELQRLRSLDAVLSMIAFGILTLTTCALFLVGLRSGFQRSTVPCVAVVSMSLAAHALVASWTRRNELHKAYGLRVLSIQFDAKKELPKRLDSLDASAKALVALDPQQTDPTQAFLAFLDSSVDLQQQAIEHAWSLPTSTQTRLITLELFLFAAMHVLLEEQKAALALTGEARKTRWLLWQRAAFQLATDASEHVAAIKNDLADIA